MQLGQQLPAIRMRLQNIIDRTVMLDKDDGNVFPMSEVNQQVDIGNDAGTAVAALL